MSISSVIQKHYRQKTSLLVYGSIDSIHRIFERLATTNIVHGNRSNPFSNHYTIEVTWNGSTAYLEGPHGERLICLATKIKPQPSTNRGYTTLDLEIGFPESYMNVWLTCMLIPYIFICFGAVSILIKLVVALVMGLLTYGSTWLYVYDSREIIMTSLSKEFSTVERV